MRWLSIIFVICLIAGCGKKNEVVAPPGTNYPYPRSYPEGPP